MPKEFYGLDISGENGRIDWERLDTSGLSFVILRITDKYGIDKEFYRNYDGAKSRGLKVGGYKYSYADNAEYAAEEAKGVVSTLSGRKLDFPIFYDLESDEQATFSSYKIGTFIEAFHEVIESAGYKFGIYTNKNWYKNIIPDFAKEKYEFWVAAPPLKNLDDGSVQERLRPSFGVGWQYSWEKKVSGHNDTFDADIFYKDYTEDAAGNKEVEKVGITAKELLDTARSYIGYRESNGSHKKIIDIYNSYTPRARGYKVQYTDQWCDTFVSAMFIKLNAVDLIGGTECGVEEHVKLFKKAGIWIEDGTITPRPGDIIVFNWGQNYQPNDGYSDHIGFVEAVSGSTITTIEGNYKDSVGRRRIAVGHGNIRGYARPKYSEAAESTTPAHATPVVTPVTHSMVRLNSYSNEVKVLQQYLNRLGYSLEVDGKFGMRTYAAVTSFQSKNGLFVDGIVGPLTWAALERKLRTVSSNAKTITAVAKDVIAGKYGNMPDRKKNLEAAGYDYNAVQKEVNKLLKG